MKTIKIASFALLTMLGVCAVVFGGYDDSPGAQMLGLIMTVTGVWFAFKLIRTK